MFWPIAKSFKSLNKSFWESRLLWEGHDLENQGLVVIIALEISLRVRPTRWTQEFWEASYYIVPMYGMYIYRYIYVYIYIDIMSVRDLTPTWNPVKRESTLMRGLAEGRDAAAKGQYPTMSLSSTYHPTIVLSFMRPPHSVTQSSIVGIRAGSPAISPVSHLLTGS